MQKDDIYRHYGWQFASGKGIDGNVPEAWLPVIATLCAKVAALIPEAQRGGFHWQDIKEKHGKLAVTHDAPAALADAVDALVDQAESACDSRAEMILTKVDVIRWQDYVIPIWRPVDRLGKPLSGGVVYLEDMPPTLQTQFKAWLAQQTLSISRPPLGLPRRGVSYFAADVVTAIEQTS